MSKRTIVFCTGIFVALLPFLGFPQSWDTVLFVFAGLVLGVVVLIPVRRGKKQAAAEHTSAHVPDRDAAFVENRPASDTPADDLPQMETDTLVPPRTARIRAKAPRLSGRASSRTSRIKPSRTSRSSSTPSDDVIT